MSHARCAAYVQVLTEPGVYVVEAVSGLLRAYTIVIVSDVGLVTKTAPGQMLVFAADRHTSETTPRPRRPGTRDPARRRRRHDRRRGRDRPLLPQT